MIRSSNSTYDPYRRMKTSNSKYLNIYENTLQSCSQKNMALTGYTRSGSCVEYRDDSGSHHICIDVSSTSGGNFCTVTGQSDWCSSSMTCDTKNYGNTDDINDNYNDNDENSSDYCPIQNWCVCQWAFASYIESAGGCDYIQDIQCDAVNLEALLAYSNMAGSSNDYNGKYTNALNCIQSRCGISSDMLNDLQSKYASARTRESGMKGLMVGTLIVGVVLCVFTLYRSKMKNEKSVESQSYLNLE